MKFKQQPEVILQELGIDAPEEIDLDLIAFTLNASVRRMILSGCEGQIIGTHSRAIITINSNSDPGRQRFSLGHELGHWINDRGKNLTYQCSDADMRQYTAGSTDFKRQKEVRANRFSAELLMPSYLFNRYHPEREITGETVRYLSNLFNVSRTSASIRLVEATDRPCMIVCWNPSGKRKWFFRNSTVPESVWPHNMILQPSYTFGETNAIEVDADQWINSKGAEDYSLIESQYYNGYDHLTLLWWKDESPLQNDDF
ncbi:MAG: ImmA/IrrE family metallo-endopeptidase [Gammaproteobacteria bacterium]|nr:MAG: ImmA/IrrE family metallo-endopeptidase [Gammaproteobacteria bacterium]